MTSQQFLGGWKSAHVNSNTRYGDAPRLVEHLLADAGNTGFDREMLIEATGGTLVQFVITSIREAIDEEIS
jgi:hypothetical protein